MANPENENRLKNKLIVWFGETVGPRVLRFLYNTNKWEIEGENYYEDAISSGKSVIIASWHSTLLTIFMGLAKKEYYGMAGNHYPDAEIISRIGNKLGWNVIRGSSTDGGRQAYDEMLDILRIPGNVFAITPDGPKGPAKVPKAGIIRAAQKTGSAVIPAAGQSSKRWSFNNWDTFYLAKPFGKTVQLFGEPLEFKITDGFDDCARRLTEALNKLEKDAENRVGMETSG
ncbi:MAG: lysophospholipid acyltransferase family protein [Candidatus Marinimicrobia bacterium]|nr:lysophospholipid acyltransferase family protein [Candidatus Neomarinimicrobiota bacterium]